LTRNPRARVIRTGAAGLGVRPLWARSIYARLYHVVVDVL
jgi:hypothetical protein